MRRSHYPKELSENEFVDKVYNCDWSTVLLAIFLVAPFVHCVVNTVISCSGKTPSAQQTSQNAYEQSMKEYEWDCYRETHEGQIASIADAIASHFPSVQNRKTFDDALEKMCKRIYLDNGAAAIKGFPSLIADTLPVVVAPKQEKACKSHGYRVGPTVGMFLCASGAPDYNSKGVVKFPFKFNSGEPKTLYSGAVFLSAKGLSVRVACNDCNAPVNISYCR